MFDCWTLVRSGSYSMICNIEEEVAVTLAEKNPTDIFFFAELV